MNERFKSLSVQLKSRAESSAPWHEDAEAASGRKLQKTGCSKRDFSLIFRCEVVVEMIVPKGAYLADCQCLQPLLI